MSSSSSAAALTRSRSLRQPGAGIGSAQRKDDPTKGLTRNNGGAVSKGGADSASASTSISTRTLSPSRLPKPGPSTTAAATATRTRSGTTGAGSNIPSTTTTAATGTRSRPNSGIFGLARSSTTTIRKPVTRSDVAEPAEFAKNTQPATKTSRLTRPKSISSAPKVSPTTSSRPSSYIASNSLTAKPQSPVTKTHARTRSQATSLTTATTLRPPRPPSAESIASTSTTTTTTNSRRLIGRSNSTARSVPPNQGPTSSLSSLAKASAHNRSSSTTTTTSSRPSKPTPTVTATDDPPRLRPTFNTLQQHYSPARNLAPKPLTSTFLAPPSPSKLPTNIAISSETARLQTELLQLHLIHRDADVVAASWHASAKESLGRRFEELAEADKAVGKDEAAVEEIRNISALKFWAEGKDLEDMIQTLDTVLSGLWSLGEPGGRYVRVVRKFEKWVDTMVTAVEARRRAGGVGALTKGDKVAFINELDPTWKDEVLSLVRKLDTWRRQLANLRDNVPVVEGQQSSLERILAGCHSQIQDMLAELDVMERIERDAISQEAAWIKRMNRDDDAGDTPKAGAIWRAL